MYRQKSRWPEEQFCRLLGTSETDVEPQVAAPDSATQLSRDIFNCIKERTVESRLSIERGMNASRNNSALIEKYKSVYAPDNGLIERMDLKQTLSRTDPQRSTAMVCCGNRHELQIER
ncbi:MAG: hypothetical protein ABR923_18650 [Terracidiphilus sp.]|jgi:hypothetical protein